MKKSVVMLFVAGFIAFCSGCVQINSSDAGSMNIHPQTEGPVDGYRPIYEIAKERVSAQSDVKCLFWIFTWGSDDAYADNANVPGSLLGAIFPFLNAKQTAAQAAFYKACKKSNSDAIIAARYEIRYENYFFFKKMTVEVKGFPARMSGIETVKPQQFYVDGSGKIIMLDKIVKPVLLYDARNNKSGDKTILSLPFEVLSNLL